MNNWPEIWISNQ